VQQRCNVFVVDGGSCARRNGGMVAGAHRPGSSPRTASAAVLRISEPAENAETPENGENPENAENAETAENRGNDENCENGEKLKTLKTAKTVRTPMPRGAGRALLCGMVARFGARRWPRSGFARRAKAGSRQAGPVPIFPG
jgi:hypothetical protein